MLLTMNEADPKRIKAVGEPIAKHVKTCKLASNIEQQLIWTEPPQS
jgi:hypothetical protein